tara:strand:- start:44 stop:325 length:282 start_codon:yes stop_codon:yes gene_type:complete
MGFDDALHDSGIINDTKELLKKVVDMSQQYIDWGQLDKYENEICYNSYSLIFHQLFNLKMVMLIGACPDKPPQKYIDMLKLKIRVEVCEMFGK